MRYCTFCRNILKCELWVKDMVHTRFIYDSHTISAQDISSFLKNCKQPKKHGFSQKLTCPLGLFGLKIFHGFNILVWLEDENYCLSSVLFGHKNRSSIPEYIYKKPYRTLPTEVKRFKNIKILQQKQGKSYIGV